MDSPPKLLTLMREKQKQENIICRYDMKTIMKMILILIQINIHANIPHLNRNPMYDKHPNLNQEIITNIFILKSG